MDPDSIVKALEAGDLPHGPWPPETAERFFARVAALMGEDPAACERLARAWSLVARRTGERALPYRAKAAADWLAGRHASAANFFRRAGEASANPIDRLAYRIGEIDSLARLGRVEEAVTLASALSKGLIELRRPDLAARARLNAANALLWQDRHGPAADHLLWAIPRLEEAGLARDAASALLALSTAYLHDGRPLEARAHATEARNRFSEMQMGHFADLAALNLAHLDLLEGRHDSALETLLDVQSRLGPEGPPADRARLLEFLGDAYLALNLPTEAEDAYRRAEDLSRFAAPLNRANVRLGLARVADLLGETAAATRAYRAAARRYAKAGNALWESVAWSGLARSLGAKKRQRAREAASRAIDLLPPNRPSPQRFEALLTLAELTRDADLAAKALRVAKAGHLAGREWAAHTLLARLRPNRALAHHRRAFHAMLESRLLQKTDLGRLAFLDDKQRALEAYMAELLAKPTRGRVAEAIRVIWETRAVALIDEVAASSAVLSDAQRIEFENLRDLLAAQASPRPDGGPTRRAGPANAQAPLRRRWNELTRRAVAVRPTRWESPDAILLAQVRDELYVLHAGDAVRLDLTADELATHLRWLSFDLLAPTVLRATGPGPALDGLEDLRKRLGPLPCLLQDDRAVLCPDGIFWQVPWTALLPEHPPTLVMRPLAQNPPPHEQRRVVIWAAHAADLPHVAREVDLLKSRFPLAEVCRTAAEARASLAEPIGRLHVAAHARLEPDAPAFSSIQFPDGPLFAVEIARSPARIGEAVLSACETARLSVASRHEPSGIARAFLARGATAVVGNAWPLDDEAATLTVGAMVDARAEGHAWHQALGMACALASERWPHPYFWGGWTLFGGC